MNGSLSVCYLKVYCILFSSIKLFPKAPSQKMYQYFGGVDKGSMYVQYVQAIQPNVPAHTTFIEIYSQIGRLID